MKNMKQYGFFSIELFDSQQFSEDKLDGLNDYKEIEEIINMSNYRHIRRLTIDVYKPNRITNQLDNYKAVEKHLIAKLVFENYFEYCF